MTNEGSATSNDPLEAALAQFADAYFGGRPIDVDEFCRTRPEHAPRLEAKIREFLYVASGLRDAFGGRRPEPMPQRSAIPERGALLGDFRLLRELGRGGMGVVYEAEQVSLRRRVALKVLSSHLSSREEAVARFEREAALVARLRHPGIVEVHAVGTVDGVRFFAMQLVDGAPLDQVVEHLRRRRDRLPDGVDFGEAIRAVLEERNGTGVEAPAHWRRSYVEVVSRIALQVAESLAHAHSLGVVHRDVKPSNVLVRLDGSVVLTDFGLARDDETSTLTRSGELTGTPHYMSPEQARGRRERVDARTDVYSLGVTLYELATLERPFAGDTPHEVVARILSSEPPSPRRRRPDLPTDFVTIVAKALEKERDRRYPTAAALAEDLRAFLSFRPIRARPNGPITRIAKLVRRRPLEAAVVPLLVLLALGAAGFGVAQSVRRLADRREREVERDVARIEQLATSVQQAIAADRFVDATSGLRDLFQHSTAAASLARRLHELTRPLRARGALALLDVATKNALLAARQSSEIQLVRDALADRFDALLACGDVEGSLAIASDAQGSGVDSHVERLARVLGPCVERVPLRSTTGGQVSGASMWVADFEGGGRREVVVDHEDGEATLLLVDSRQVRTRVVRLVMGPARVFGVADVDGTGRQTLVLQRDDGGSGPSRVLLLDLAQVFADLRRGVVDSVGRPGPTTRLDLTIHGEEFGEKSPMKFEHCIVTNLEPDSAPVLVLAAIHHVLIVHFGSASSVVPVVEDLDRTLREEEADVRDLATVATPFASRLVVATGYHHSFAVRIYDQRGRIGTKVETTAPRVSSLAVGNVGTVAADVLADVAKPHLLALVSDTPESRNLPLSLHGRGGGLEGARVCGCTETGDWSVFDSPRWTIGDLVGDLPTENVELRDLRRVEDRSGGLLLYRVNSACEPPGIQDYTSEFVGVLDSSRVGHALCVVPARTVAAGDLDGDGDDEVLLLQDGQVVVTGLSHDSPLREMAASAFPVDSPMRAWNDALAQLSSTEHRTEPAVILRFTDRAVLSSADDASADVDQLFASGRFEQVASLGANTCLGASRTFADEARRPIALAEVAAVARFFAERGASRLAATGGIRTTVWTASQAEGERRGGKVVASPSAATEWPTSAVEFDFGRRDRDSGGRQLGVVLAPPCRIDDKPTRFTVDFRVAHMDCGTMVSLGPVLSAVDPSRAGRLELETQRAPRRPVGTCREVRWQRDHGGWATRRSSHASEFDVETWYRLVVCSAPRLGVRFVELRPREREFDVEPTFAVVQFGAPFREPEGASAGILCRYTGAGDDTDLSTCRLLVDQASLEVLQID